MPVVSQTIKNLKGGISQQPDILRFPDQGELQVNGFSSEVEGLQKRPPTVHIKRLGNSLGTMKPLVRMINRDATERYYIRFNTSGVPVVHDLAGNQYTVNAPTGSAYLNTPNPREDLRMVTVADYTFVVNRKVIAKMKTTVAHPGYRKDGQFLINIKGGQYGRTYRVILNGAVVGSITTPDGSLPAHAAQIDTQYITNQLVTAMTPNMGGWTLTAGPNWIKASHPTLAVSSLRIEDGFNNGLATGVIFEAQRFNMLPAQAPDGYIVKVTGDPGSGADDYYIQFNASKIVWEETVAPGATVELDDTTMPHGLIREADGTFTFRPLDWQDRPVGDLDSSPDPSFIGGTINDVFFFRNRLGLLSGENIILSASGRFFDFFPKSVVVVADTDPIDVAVSHTRVSILNHAVPFAEELLLWSDQTQFVLRADGVLSSKTVKVDQSTEFESAIHARPVAAGRGVYFAAPRASFTSIRRYYAVQDVSAVKNAEDVTAHVPSYIPNGVYDLGSSTTENIVSVLTEGYEQGLFLYKYLYLDEQLAQQSWSHWDFGTGSRVLACEMIGAIMYLLIDTPSGLYLESLEFTQNTKDLAEEPYRLYMDRKAKASGMTYDDDTGRTSIPLATIYGAIPSKGTYWVVQPDGRAWEFPEPTGGWSTVGGLVQLTGDLTGQQLIVGRAFEFRYRFSKFLIKVQEQNGGVKSEDTGRLQMQRAWVNYNNSGPFNVEVNGKFVYTMSGKVLGTYVLGEQALDTGQFRFPLASEVNRTTVDIVSASPGPVALIGAGWKGSYFKREQAL